MKLFSLFLMGLIFLQSTAFAQNNSLSEQVQMHELVKKYKEEFEKQDLSHDELKKLRGISVAQQYRLRHLYTELESSQKKLDLLYNQEQTRSKNDYKGEIKAQYLKSLYTFAGFILGALLSYSMFKSIPKGFFDFLEVFPMFAGLGFAGASLVSFGMSVKSLLGANQKDIKESNLNRIKKQFNKETMAQLTSEIDDNLEAKISAIDLILAEQ